MTVEATEAEKAPEQDAKPDETTEPTDQDTTTPPELEGSEKDPETFTRDYVEKLRRESAGYRDRAKDRDDLAKRLFTAQVTATGRLADPTDLPFSEELLDPEKLAEAIDDLLARKPHLASRKPNGNVGQGEGTGSGAATVNLAELLRANA
jgi:hypothetical protein